MKLEVGKSYKTRGGWKADVTDYQGIDDYYGDLFTVCHTTKNFSLSHKTDGLWAYGHEGECDIIAEWEEPMPEVDLTKITTPFGLLDKDTQERLKAHGGPYEMVQIDGWQFWDYPTWTPYMTYRVKPKPFVEYKKTDYIQGFSDRVYTITEKFVDGKYDSYTVDMVRF